MDNQVKMPKFEQGNFSPETNENGPEFFEDKVENTQEVEKSDIDTSEPLVAKFEIKPEVKTEDSIVDEDENGVADEDDELIVRTFKGSKSEEGGTSGKVESLISKTDSTILHKERDPHKFVNYWRRMKVAAMDEWFNRKIGGEDTKDKSAEKRVGEGQESDKTLEILQGRRADDIQQNVVENVSDKQGEEQIGVVENVDEKGGEIAA